MKALKAETGKIGKKGTVVIPAHLRKRFGITDGALVIIEAQEDGILIRRAVALPLEIYSPERQAEFLLSNTTDAKDYARACKEVRRLGLNPEQIPHHKPEGA